MRVRSLAWSCLMVLALAGCGGGSGGVSLDDGGDDGTPLPPPQDRRLNTDGAGAQLSFEPQVCCDGNAIYAVWADRRAGLLDIHFNRSVDAGRTWLPADFRLNTDGAGGHNAQLPQICCSGSAVYVVWCDERNGLGDIYCNRSLDAGATWLASDVRLDTDLVGTAESRNPQICCDGSAVYVTWSDRRSGNYDIYASRSQDGGVSWLASDVRVDNDTGSARSTRPTIACAGMSVRVVWTDARDGGSDVYTSRSSDNGLTWSADIRVNDGSGAGLTTNPQIANVNDDVFVVWDERRGGLADIRLNRSANGGSTWLANDVRLDTDVVGAGKSTLPTLCVDGAAVYVAWQDERHGMPDVYFNRSLNGGATWLADDARLETDAPGVSVSFAPRICCDGASVAVTWYDDRNGKMDVFATFSPDGGTKWLAMDLRLDDDEPGIAHSITPRPCCVGDRVVVVWSDQRDGSGDIFARSAEFGGL